MAIVSKDSLRSSIEASTGGLCTVLYDEAGHPNIMRRIPKFKIEDVLPDLGLTGTHPAFIVNGVEKSELFISVFANTVVDNVGVSLPGLDPSVNMNFDQAVACLDPLPESRSFEQAYRMQCMSSASNLDKLSCAMMKSAPCVPLSF